MPLDIFKGISRAMGPLLAKRIDKEDFLDQLREAWVPVVKKAANVEEELASAMERIKKSGFEKTFKAAGVTEEDIRQVLVDIQESKGETIRRGQPKVGRNSLCPCGSGKKYKRCCGE